ncbi:MAG: hypothetical protein HOF34_12740 [Rhodospirillaceae bacterium]|nr:hypothetical protein [Rhodospirillaceae bacterium]
MTEQPDFAALARQYLDLWEDQLSAMAADPDLAEQTARFFDTMTQLGAISHPMGASGLAALMAQMSGHASATTDGSDGPKDQPTSAAGAASAAAAPDDRDQRLDELTRRLADVEERLHRLESGDRGARRATAKKPAGGTTGRKRS